MKTVKPSDVAKLDKMLRSTKKPMSLGALAKRLDVSYTTAQRWFEIWKQENDYETGYARTGLRGPEAFVVRAL